MLLLLLLVLLLFIELLLPLFVFDNKLFIGLFAVGSGGISDPLVASDAGFGVRTVGGSETGNVVVPPIIGDVVDLLASNGEDEWG